jgi:hypothetical protein
MAVVSNGLTRVSSQMALHKRTVADADPPHIRGRPKRDGVVSDPPVPIRRGKGGAACQEGGMGNVGDPSRMRSRDPQQFDCEMVWAGVGEGHFTAVDPEGWTA